MSQVKSSDIYRQRRAEFMRRIGDGVGVFASAPVALRNSDVEHEYRQDSDLYYLTGFEEPDAVAVLAPAHPEKRFTLFVQPREREREVWTGWRAGEEGAVRDFGADAAFTIDKLAQELPDLTGPAEALYYRFGNPRFDERVVEFLRRSQRERQRNGRGPSTVVDPAGILHEMRLKKTADDIELLRRAVEISAEGHLAAMRELKPGIHEYEIEATLRYVFRRHGSARHGYAPIVASGANATVLHYTTNDRRIEAGDLVLIDAGAEFGYYTGDLTRTLPASGRFTRDQAAVYQIVLEAQLAAIAEVRPGARFDDPHDRALQVLTEGMVRLGLLKGDVKELIEKTEYKKFYMHRTSHWLGMDVHDVGAYKLNGESRTLEPSMTLTIEPGLYIAADQEEVDPRYRGIGVRIEDDVLVTQNGCEVLSAQLPKTIEEIESLMGA